jgi:4-hydroxy-3-methylbut-2-en-1-yl diphosphate synthase IspG/GcpE
MFDPAIGFCEGIGDTIRVSLSAPPAEERPS